METTLLRASCPDERNRTTSTMSCEDADSIELQSSDDEVHSSKRSVCISCPEHGTFLDLKDVQASAEGGAIRRLVIYNHLVYDVTDFQHPGGNDLLDPYIGNDITEAFDEIGHSRNAHQILGSLCVGVLMEEKDAYLKDTSGVCTCVSIMGTGRRKEAGPRAAGLKRRSIAAAAAAAASAAKDTTTDGDSVDSAGTERTNEMHEVDDEGETAGLEPHSLIDFSKPLVPQIYYLNNADYKRVVDTPHCKDDVFQLLPWERLEPLTKTQWWIVPLFWLPICSYLSWAALQQLRPLVFAGVFIFGLFAWTILEYCLHRFVFHFPEDYLPDLGWVRVVHFLLHAVHHMLPMDPLRLVMPPALLLLLSVPVYCICSLVLPQWFIWGGWPGGLTGYLLYDMIHYTTHHCAFLERINHIREMKRYHMKHHFKYPLLGFGVSTKIWDFAFGTVIPDA